MTEELNINGHAAIAACCNVVAELVSSSCDSAEIEERLVVNGQRSDLVEFEVTRFTHVVRCPNFHCRRDHQIHQTVETKGAVLQKNVYGFEA